MSPYNLQPSTSAAMRNREPILAQLRQLFASTSKVLEIGSGVGAHAAYFSEKLPHLIWQPSEQPSQIAYLSHLEASTNLCVPITLSLVDEQWPAGHYDAAFMANVLHMFPEDRIADALQNMAKVLSTNGLLVVYGPFKEEGRHTGLGNQQFDQSLRQQNEHFGIRDTADLKCWGDAAGLRMREPIMMPSNNRLLVWDKA